LFQALRQLDSILEKTDTDIKINRFKGGEYLMDIIVGKEKVR